MVVRQGIVVLVAFIPFRAEAKRGENPRSSDVQNLLQVSLPYSTSDIRFFAPFFSFSRFLASYTALLFVRILSSIDSLCTRGTLNNNTGSLIVDISTSLCTTNAIDFLRISRTHRLSPNPIGPTLTPDSLDNESEHGLAETSFAAIESESVHNSSPYSQCARTSSSRVLRL